MNQLKEIQKKSSNNQKKSKIVVKNREIEQ